MRISFKLSVYSNFVTAAIRHTNACPDKCLWILKTAERLNKKRLRSLWKARAWRMLNN